MVNFNNVVKFISKTTRVIYLLRHKTIQILTTIHFVKLVTLTSISTGHSLISKIKCHHHTIIDPDHTLPSHPHIMTSQPKIIASLNPQPITNSKIVSIKPLTSNNPPPIMISYNSPKTLNPTITKLIVYATNIVSNLQTKNNVYHPQK